MECSGSGEEAPVERPSADRVGRGISGRALEGFPAACRAWFTGHKVSPLLRLDAVRDKLEIRGQHYAGLQSIPVGQIVGSAGRYHDFNRAFLPEQEYVKQRWRRVYAAAHSQQGFAPIEVYQVGEAYFVRDGHRGCPS